MGIAATFVRLAKQVFFNVAIVLILFFLPLDVLFHLSSWTLFMPTLDMVNQVVMLIVLLTLVSASVALLVAGAGCTMVGLPFRKAAEDTEERVYAVVAIGSLAMIVLLFLKALKTWLAMVAGINPTLGAAKLLVVLLVIGIFWVWAWKYGLLAAGNAIRRRLAKGNKVVLILIISASLVVATNGIVLHDYHEIKTNPIAAIQAKEVPNIILLSIDTLTAEDMSLYGYQLPTTPKLEAFAKESYVFDNFFAASNWTAPSVASFISGLYPVTSGVNQIYSYFLEEDQKKNLGQALKDNGYQTVAIVANVNAHPLLLQISDGFSATTETPERKLFAIDSVADELFRLKNYRTYLWQRDLLLAVSQILPSYRDEANSLWPPELAFDRALPFFSIMRQPSFVWIHIFPPHRPYLPAAPFRYKFGNFKAFSTLNDYVGNVAEYSPKRVAQQRLRYDEFILDTDSRVGDFLAKLKAMGRFDDSIIVITADHGESFTEKVVTHGGRYLYQPLIHIPLIIHLPGQKKGKRIPYYAGHVDLLPTIMDLVDLPIPKWVQGESLKAAVLEGKPTSLPKFSMNLDKASRFAPPSKGTVAVMHDGWKLVHYLGTDKEELYHLASDPRETVDLTSTNPEQAKRMRDLIYDRFNIGR